jgi:hypothetical protein
MMSIAFSSEEGTGPREENASKQDVDGRNKSGRDEHGVVTCNTGW